MMWTVSPARCEWFINCYYHCDIELSVVTTFLFRIWLLWQYTTDMRHVVVFAVRCWCSSSSLSISYKYKCRWLNDAFYMHRYIGNGTRASIHQTTNERTKWARATRVCSILKRYNLCWRIPCWMPLKLNIIISVHIPQNLFTHEKLKFAFIAFVVIVVDCDVEVVVQPLLQCNHLLFIRNTRRHTREYPDPRTSAYIMVSVYGVCAGIVAF